MRDRLAAAAFFTGMTCIVLAVYLNLGLIMGLLALGGALMATGTIVWLQNN